MEASNPRPPRKGLVVTLVVLGTLAGFLALPALWLNRQLLNTDNWTATSSELLESKPIREQVANYLVEQLYDNVNVQAELARALPPQAQGLAGPAASGLRSLADQGADELLGRPRVQQLWEDANRAASTALLKVVDGGGDNVSTDNGTVKLDLRNILVEASATLGVGQQLVAQIPEGSAQITVLKSDQLAAAQDVAQYLKDAAFILTALALLLFAAAIAVAGRRRQALRAVGVGLVVAGAGALVVREFAGSEVVDSLASTAAVRPAVESAWSIGTSLLVEAAESCITYGVVIVFAAWLAGRTSVATSTRRSLAPFLRDARFAYGGLSALVLLLIVWGPTPATRAPLTMLLLVAILAFGVEVLRRQVAREFPEATLEAVGERRRARLGRARDAMSSTARRFAPHNGPPAAPAAVPPTPAPPVAPVPDATAAVAAAPAAPAPDADRLERLERLARLREAGILDDEELAREKALILAG